MALLFALPLLALQGLVIFVTAWAAMRWLKLVNPWWKPLFIAISWLTWCVGTITVFHLTGGGGGLMDGMGMMLMLCATAFVSALAYAVGWIVWPFLRR